MAPSRSITSWSAASAELRTVMTYQCPVCGFPGLYEPARSPEGGDSYEICPSCGFEFGVTDDDLGYSYDRWREGWISRGMPWSSVGRSEPDGWDPRAQMKNIRE